MLQKTSTSPGDQLMSTSEATVLRTVLRCQQLGEGVKLLDEIRSNMRLENGQGQVSDYISSCINAKREYLLDRIVSTTKDLKGLPSEFHPLLPRDGDSSAPCNP